MDIQLIRTVLYISRDERAKIATCSLLTPTDRFKENYSIDSVYYDWILDGAGSIYSTFGRKWFQTSDHNRRKNQGRYRVTGVQIVVIYF